MLPIIYYILYKQLMLKICVIITTQIFVYLFVPISSNELISFYFLDFFINSENAPSAELIDKWEANRDEDYEDPTISKEERAMMVKRDYIQFAKISSVSFVIVLFIIWFVDNPDDPTEWWPEPGDYD